MLIRDFQEVRNLTRDREIGVQGFWTKSRIGYRGPQ